MSNEMRIRAHYSLILSRISLLWIKLTKCLFIYSFAIL